MALRHDRASLTSDFRPLTSVVPREKGCGDGGPRTPAGVDDGIPRGVGHGPIAKLACGRPSCEPRKEVIQPQVPLRLPCYDFTPVADLTVVGCLLTVGAPPSGKTNSHGVTGGVYKARERIHRGMLIRDY